MAHVAGGEDSRNARLQKERIALERPRPIPLRDEIEDVSPGTNVATLVANHRGRKPRCLRVGADEHEQRLRCCASTRAALTVLDDDRFEMLGSFERDDLAHSFDLNVRLPRELLDQVMRHAGRERRSANEDRESKGLAFSAFEICCE